MTTRSTTRRDGQMLAITLTDAEVLALDAWAAVRPPNPMPIDAILAKLYGATAR